MKVGAIQQLSIALLALGLPRPLYEVGFHPTRTWRFDIAYPDRMIAIEIDGGVFRGGRHTSGVGFTRDLVKLNTATEMGWKVYRFTPGMVRSGEAIELLKRVLA